MQNSFHSCIPVIRIHQPKAYLRLIGLRLNFVEIILTAAVSHKAKRIGRQLLGRGGDSLRYRMGLRPRSVRSRDEVEMIELAPGKRLS